jgi:hypothetical protein
MKIPGSFRLCKPLSRSKNGVVHERMINARTQLEMRKYMENTNSMLFVKRTAKEAKMINGNASKYRLKI